MAAGFGRESGPAAPAKHVPSFGQFTNRPASPPFSNLTSAPSLRVSEVVEETRPPPLPGFGNSGSPVGHFQAFTARKSEAPQRVASPPSPFQSHSPATSPYSSAGLHRPSIEPPRRLDDTQRPHNNEDDVQTHLRRSAAMPLAASSSIETSTAAKTTRLQELKRSRSPPLPSRYEEFAGNSSQTDNSRPALSSSPCDDRAHVLGNYPNSLAQQDQSIGLPHANFYDNERSFIGQETYVQGPKRTRSLSTTSAIGVSREDSQFASNDSKRLANRSNAVNAVLGSSTSQAPQRSTPYSNSTTGAATRSNVSLVPKRTRSPPLPSFTQDLQENSISTQYDAEREMQAKAKRLARFKVELCENVQISPEVTDQRASNNVQGRYVLERQKFIGAHPAESEKDYANENALPDNEGSEASSVIVGLCPDMCPESERAERERKGDLDRYERLDGDRNQTTENIAVKKYNRTAEREANLIRPMPILQKTVGYLLSLLDQPYGDGFLGLYNFLWDRMRAIRMDLRMQHIFNQEAITMLERMIRLHIIAMHELCEYTKGEGFSEGFDAHLNIEQMNKTSVELFQMYDDHRKRGLNVPTEREFRGYYALLKIDKHPGYKVEPAELSLDLAKMTPEIRQTPEVLFARSVARACRTGNFIAFFRLARKASYLQACLMHAHFAKLRTQALASLYSGLLNNQGLPVTHVGRWLGMEEEDIDSLVQYHGFLIKEFEEPYMVKEGPFLNSDKDYPTKCSELVLLKRSGRIVEDVAASRQVTPLPAIATKAILLGTKYKPEIKAITSVERKVSCPDVEEEMPDSLATSSPKKSSTFEPMIATTMVGQQCQDSNQRTVAPVFPWVFPLAHSSLSLPAKVMTEEKQIGDAPSGVAPEEKRSFGLEGSPTQLVARVEALKERSPSFKRYDYPVESLLPQTLANKSVQCEEPQDAHLENKSQVMQDENDEVKTNYLDEEVALAKLKLILRLWRRCSLKKKKLREQRQLAANAALDSLSLGPPIRQINDQPSTCVKFDIDHVMRERSERHGRSWSRLNVSDLIAGILGKKNPEAKCLCWKLVVCSQDSLEVDKKRQRKPISHLAAGPWLLSKLIPSEKDDDDVAVASPGLAIWKKWVPSQSGADQTCCFSIIKETHFDHLNDAVSGATAVLFLVSESIPWKIQKARLCNIISLIPAGSCLPLLILSCSYSKEDVDPYAVISKELALHEIDKSRINRFLVKFLAGNQQIGVSDDFFSDEQLREGLRWLSSESPNQPVVYCVRTRELILTHLSSALDVLGKSSYYEVSPNHCISAFNEALDQSLWEIFAAAKENPSSWPCPEIALVEDSGVENLMEDWCLPCLGWSSVARLHSLEHALKDLKLPAFPDDVSFLSSGYQMGKEIENQRLHLEDCLIRYLTLSSKMMAVPLARKEASIMLQRSARLELRNLRYYIVPNWVMIFRRIFNWRLTIIKHGAVSSSYVLRQRPVSCTSDYLDKLGVEGTDSPYSLFHTSLDEMMEVSCTTRPSKEENTESGCSPVMIRGAQPQPAVASTNDTQDLGGTTNLVEEERNSSEENELTVAADDISYIMQKLKYTAEEVAAAVPPKVAKETDNLGKLFEKCKLVQNTNENKLYFYF